LEKKKPVLKQSKKQRETLIKSGPSTNENPEIPERRTVPVRDGCLGEGRKKKGWNLTQKQPLSIVELRRHQRGKVALQSPTISKR